MNVAGVLLAAGAGRRMGTPKALLRDEAGVPHLDRAVGRLLDGGCARVTVVLGAAADEARRLLEEAGWTDDEDVDVVTATDWDQGMGASLRRGLAAVEESDPDVVAALVSLVDLPDVTADVVARVLDGDVDADVLARASYHGEPGHPVLLGRAHWPAIGDAAVGDRGARDYLGRSDVAPHVRLVECADLATGRDLDHPTDLSR
jgi:CTP:molybdopterin cytidylyltransferase MocA